MMRRMLGAPLGGTMRGGHQGLEFRALSLMTPPNFRGRGGSCFPSSVVVALGEPNTPVTCCAATGAMARLLASRNAATSAMTPMSLGPRFMLYAPLLIRSCLMPRARVDADSTLQLPFHCDDFATSMSRSVIRLERCRRRLLQFEGALALLNAISYRYLAA